MAITNVRQYFLDTLVEAIGIKSGLAVTIPDARKILQRDPPDEGWWKGKRTDLVRLDAVEIECVFLKLLYLLGAIPDERRPDVLLYDYALNNPFKLPKEYESKPKTPARVRALRAVLYLQSVLIEHLEYRKPLPKKVAALPGFSEMVKEYARREIMDGSFPDSRTWNGIVSLSDLFESEDAPSEPGIHFDQRFIDYLNAQRADLTKMNWRQFEFLTGEYFRRNGYKVTIGPGRADGGVDVRAAKDRVLAGPDVILIQCKRLKEPNEVEINEVKALWADVRDEGAAGGLIATTTRLAKGSRDYCNARRYQLSRAEQENVLQWIREMASLKLK